MAVTNLAKSALQEYKSDANEVVHFKLVKQGDDLQNAETTFHPEMSHQIFGSSETIFGYKGLTVELYYSASRLSTLVNIKYDEIINPAEFDGVQPDDILRELAKQLPAGFHTKPDDFITSLEKEIHFKPFGEMLHSYSRTKDGETHHFEIYKNTIEASGFRSYHEKLQTFLLWYVDAASYIDVDDDRWSYYLVYEKAQLSCGTTMYYIVGYQTVYAYYAYPELLRPRISQVLILPPYQRQGHGGELLQTFYRECWGNDNILDITVEDPSEDFQRLRDFIDVRNCMKLDIFSSANLEKGFTKDLVKECQGKLKINKKQCRRVYEILKLKYSTPLTLKMYRLEVKKRLHQPFQSSRKDFGKMEKVLNPEEYEACQVTKKDKHVILESLYNECMETYRHVLERIAAATTT